MSIDITERVTANQRMSSSEERLREAVQAAGFGVFEHDHEGESFHWSERLREIYGVDGGTVPNLSLFLKILHPDDREKVERAIKQALDPCGNGRFDIEFRVIRQNDGEVRWLSANSQTRFAGVGLGRHPVRTVGAVVDATEARLASESLRLSEMKYRQLVDILPTAIFVHCNNSIVFGNPSFLRMLSCKSLDEIIDRSPFEFVPIDDHESLRERQRDMETTGRPFPGCEMRVRRSDGHEVPVFGIAAPINGYAQQATLVALSDLTECKRVTAQLRSVLNSVSDAILTINSSGKITSVNSATERLFGFSAVELLDQNVNILMPEPRTSSHDRCVADHLLTVASHVMGIGKELVGRRKDGSLFPVELSVTEFLQDGERHFTVVLRDITASRELEQQFRQSQKWKRWGG